MGRILAIDYGRKRTGLAVTDPLGLIPGGLGTIPSHTLMGYLDSYFQKEQVDLILVGHPRQMDYQESESMKYIRPMLAQLEKRFPEKRVEMVDERFTSVLAQRAIREAGIKKQRRREDKGLIDEISAVILLEGYLTSRAFLS